MLLIMANKRRNSSWAFANISMIICFGIAIPTTESFETAPPAVATETLPTTECSDLLSETQDTVTTLSPVVTTTPSTTAFPISVDPLFGPIAGGTHITIIGSIAIGDIWIYVGSIVTGVRNVYIGKDLSSTSVSLLPTDGPTFELVAVTPNTTEASVGQPLPIIIEFLPTPFNLSSNKLFVYLPNPEITGIYPDSFIAIGGTLIDVFGKSLSSVAKPIIQLTIIISRADQNRSTSNTSTRICVVPPDNGTYMQCPMPPLSLPDDFLEILNLRYNATVTRRRRSRDQINQFIPYSNNQLSRMKRDSDRVLTIQGQNEIDRADVYLGFLLDGEKRYENINGALPDTKLIFYSAPEINSSDELIQFDPSEDNMIHVKGEHMSRGCRLIDYVVHIGNQICTNIDLQNNHISCRPPKVEPSSTSNDTIYCHQHLSISITIGYKQYQYACLAYTDHSRRLALIIGLTVGLAAFAILLTILIVFIVRCRRKNVSQETDRHQHPRGVELRNRDVINAEQQESPEDLNIIHTRHNTTTTMCKPDDVYANALQYEPQHDYDHRIEEYYENDRRCSRI